jgi:hypothetical protein
MRYENRRIEKRIIMLTVGEKVVGKRIVGKRMVGKHIVQKSEAVNCQNSLKPNSMAPIKTNIQWCPVSVLTYVYRHRAFNTVDPP